MTPFSLTFNDIKVNWFTLSFPDDLEKDFLEDYFNKSLTHVRIALLMAIFFYGIFGILDAWLLPELKTKLWFIRYAIFVPFTALIMVFSFSKWFRHYMQLSNAAVVLLAGLGIIGMVLIAPHSINYSYYAGLLLVFIFGYTFFKLRFVWATLVGWLIVIAYEIAAILLSQTPVPVLVNNNFFFLTGNILGMFACYSIEFYLRKEFIQARLLEAEKRKVKAANLELEKRVAERTTQLVLANKDLMQEIAERKRSVEALKVSEEKYRTILENMQEGYFEVDLSGNLQFTNKSAAEILGYLPEEMLSLNYRDFTDEVTADKMYKVFNEVFNNGKSVHVMDYGVIRKDGTTRILSMSTTLQREVSGEPVGFRGVARDDTDRKLAEEKIRQMNDELEQRVAQRTAQLNIANKALKESFETVSKTQDRLVQTEKMAALGNLVAGVAHEINTPIGIGVTAASLLEDKSSNLVNLHNSGKLKRSDFESYLKTASDSATYILSNLKRAAELIRSFKQVAVDQSSEERRKFKLKEYVEYILLSLRPRFKKTKHKVRLECPANLVVNSYPGPFSQIITNLVMNSLVHGFDGIEKGEITFTISEEDQDILMQYSDNGKGMNADILQNIYNPFFTTERGKGGTGLGMHIVFNLVTQTLGGDIKCASTPNEGTLFTIQIPIKKAVKNE